MPPEQKYFDLFSGHLSSGDLPMCLMLFERESREQPPELPLADCDRPGCILLRPAKPALFQPSVVKPESRSVPIQDFELVAASVAEDKKAVGEDIKLETKCNHCSEAVDALSHVRRSTREIYRIGNVIA